MPQSVRLRRDCRQIDRRLVDQQPSVPDRERRTQSHAPRRNVKKASMEQRQRRSYRWRAHLHSRLQASLDSGISRGVACWLDLPMRPAPSAAHGLPLARERSFAYPEPVAEANGVSGSVDISTMTALDSRDLKASNSTTSNWLHVPATLFYSVCLCSSSLVSAYHPPYN